MSIGRLRSTSNARVPDLQKTGHSGQLLLHPGVLQKQLGQPVRANAPVCVPQGLCSAQSYTCLLCGWAVKSCTRWFGNLFQQQLLRRCRRIDFSGAPQPSCRLHFHAVLCFVVHNPGCWCRSWLSRHAGKFGAFSFTGPLRPFDVTQQMTVPDHIPKPDYAVDGKQTVVSCTVVSTSLQHDTVC